MKDSNEIINDFATKEYEYGFITDIEMDIAPAGLDEDIIHFISEKKNEPAWLLDWRLKGYQAFQKEQMPHWQNFEMPEMDFQKISYYAAPKNKKKIRKPGRSRPGIAGYFC
jgi:Fe-S cluster assembly protein SufB